MSSCADHDADHRREHLARGLVVRQSGVQDPNHDRHRGEALVRQDADLLRLDVAQNDQDSTTRSDPCDRSDQIVGHHQGADHERLRRPGDVAAVVARGCRQAAVESCDHQRAQRADQTVWHRAEARVYQVQYHLVVVLADET